MSDLRCRKCGATVTYADAQIADINKTCKRTRTVEAPGGFRETTVPAKHDWVEA